MAGRFEEVESGENSKDTAVGEFPSSSSTASRDIGPYISGSHLVVQCGNNARL